MPTVSQIRGMLLEEAVLQLLRPAGYRTVERPGRDPTLKLGFAGVKVRGRGCYHQIDLSVVLGGTALNSSNNVDIMLNQRALGGRPMRRSRSWNWGSERKESEIMIHNS